MTSQCRTLTQERLDKTLHTFLKAFLNLFYIVIVLFLIGQHVLGYEDELFQDVFEEASISDTDDKYW